MWFLGFAVPDESQIPCLPSLPNVSTLLLSLPICRLTHLFFIFLPIHPPPHRHLFIPVRPPSSLWFFFFALFFTFHPLPCPIFRFSFLFLTITCPLFLSPVLFFLSTHLFFLQEATFIFGLHCSVCICHVLHLPLTDPLETVVVLRV